MEHYLLMHKEKTQTLTHNCLMLGDAHFFNQMIDSIVIIPVRISCKEAARQAFLFIYFKNQVHKTWLVNQLSDLVSSDWINQSNQN